MFSPVYMHDGIESTDFRKFTNRSEESELPPGCASSKGQCIKKKNTGFVSVSDLSAVAHLAEGNHRLQSIFTDPPGIRFVGPPIFMPLFETSRMWMLRRSGENGLIVCKTPES